MSGVWIFNKKGVARLISNPTRESFEHKESTRPGVATAPGARRRVLVYLPSNQVIGSYAELEPRLIELGWKRYNGQKPDLIQFHRSETSVHLISLPKDFANFKSTHMYDIVVKNRSYFEVRDHQANLAAKAKWNIKEEDAVQMVIDNLHGPIKEAMVVEGSLKQSSSQSSNKIATNFLHLGLLNAEDAEAMLEERLSKKGEGFVPESTTSSYSGMKCFHFSNAERREDDDGSVSRISKVSWARSLSVASSSLGLRRSEFESESRDFSDSVLFHDFLSQRRANDLRVFAFSELRSATRGFSRVLMIGEGGFGCVYRGFVRVSDDDGPDSEMEVAIKQLNRNGLQARSSFPFIYLLTENSVPILEYRLVKMDVFVRSEIPPALACIDCRKGHKEWITEVNFLGVVNHPNLVKLVGYCAEDDERGIQRLLVYELMHNKSLEDHLLARVPSPLSWMMRLRIAQDAARGLAYLHEEMDFQLSAYLDLVKLRHQTWLRLALPVLEYKYLLHLRLLLIFRDFKTSNILLDEDFNAKLSDFGLARQGPTEGLGHVSTSVVGTVGYAAPEYVQTGRLTAKSDVWSFGVVLYELITGRRSLERNLPRSEQKLLEWVKPYVSDSKKFHLILDPRLEGQYSTKSVQKLVSLANKCLMKQPKSRPKMSEVVEMLGLMISETSPDEGVTQHLPNNETEDTKEESVEETESTKQGNSYLKRVFDFREMVSLRNKSVAKLDWRNWTPGAAPNELEEKPQVFSVQPFLQSPLINRGVEQQKRLDLEEEVVKLQAELDEEQKLNRVLQCALKGPVVSSPSLRSLLPLQVQVLLAELAMVEEEIICLERKVEELKLRLYQEKKQTKEWEMQQPQYQQWPQRQQKHLLCGIGSGREFTDLEHVLIINNRADFRSQRLMRERKASLGSASNIQSMSSTRSNDEIAERSRRRNGKIRNQSLLDEEEKPNRLSEELIKCLIGIFLKLNRISAIDCDGSATVPKLTLSCINSKGFISKTSFNFKAPPFFSDDNKSYLDPYSTVSDLDGTIRDVGPYKKFMQFTRNSLDMSCVSECCFPDMGKLRVLMHKLCTVDLSFLTYKQKLAFWINIYNACIMHVFLQHGLPSTPDKLLALMNKAALNVGGIVLNALAIEHFILRYPCDSKNGAMDEKERLLRHAYGLGYPEPNVTFALCRGSWSSPALRIYTAEDVVNELGRAKVEYLEASVGVTSKKKIVVPKLLQWHMRDFADDMESLVEWIYSQLPRFGSLKRLIMECLNGDTRSPIAKIVEIQPYESEFRYMMPL
ncbi:hypothetical protein HHK36_016398 [Tetracentron sinense]|uniref:Protein kinase domain-containing protein n=1 Tax=Tetracentron sinense TaxID=13715 RepID=A0A834Z2P1_TETSI|nr:hypothetical protein HHK36_016398 [Tetracentron sinense]